MKALRRIFRITAIIAALISCVNIGILAQNREILNFNFDWKFHKGDITGGQDVSFDDSGWRNLDLPHDWSIEGPFSKDNSSCTGYLPGGIGWYRKAFTIPEKEKGKRVFIYFDGVYNNSEVWKKMGSPQNPSAEQYSELEKAGMLQQKGQAETFRIRKGKLSATQTLQFQGVGLLRIEWDQLK